MGIQLSLFKSTLAIMMLALPYANISNLINIEDGLVYLIYPICLALFFAAAVQKGTCDYKLDAISIIVLISMFFSVMSSFFGAITLVTLLSIFLKYTLLLFLLNIVKQHNGRTIDFILRNYSRIFIWSLILSLFMYLFIRKPEFIFYDGSASRFGGFHFELFNFCYSASVCCASLLYRGLSKFVTFLVLLFLAYISKSNFSPIYLIIYIASFYTSLLNSVYLRRMGTLLVLLAPLVVGAFLNELSILGSFSVRESTSFDHNGSSTFTRLYPYSLAYSQLVDGGAMSLIPKGFGFFESSELIREDVMSYGGTGSPKEVVNLGVLLFGFLAFVLVKSIPRKLHHNLPLHNFLWFSTIAFISFGSGFFNLFAWVIIFALLHWRVD